MRIQGVGICFPNTVHIGLSFTLTHTLEFIASSLSVLKLEFQHDSLFRAVSVYLEPPLYNCQGLKTGYQATERRKLGKASPDIHTA
jgi:hypothetical protein